MMIEHPCFNPQAHEFARIHLPVAPECNLSCIYCDRRGDCPHESRPGLASRLMTPEQGLELVNWAVGAVERLTVVGIAGPGDPLATPDETLTTLRLVQHAYPQLMLCLSTSGLGLPRYLEQLVHAGLQWLTVTVNAIDEGTAGQLCGGAMIDGHLVMGVRAGRRLIDDQLSSLAAAVRLGVSCKINFVLVPGFNDDQAQAVATAAAACGVKWMNVMPVIAPQSKEGVVASATAGDVARVVDQLPGGIQALTHCRRCRADAVGKLSDS